MKIQPRQHILEIWRATARSSIQSGDWAWAGRDEPNSISDAEQLLCLMGPATQIPAFRLDKPNETAEDILRALRVLGGATDVPRQLVRGIADYLRRYTDDTGTPIFSAASYLTAGNPRQARPPEQGTGPETLTPEQGARDLVDSFATSVTLMLATIGFARVFRTQVSREDIRRDVDEMEAMANRRLTAAMVGLLRSFAVYVFDADAPEGAALIRTARQSNLTGKQVAERLRDALREVNAGLRDLSMGSGQVGDLEETSRLFECGWSWGIVRDAPEIKLIGEDIGTQRAGTAQEAPYLYFTVVALEGIAALFSERTRLLGLLNDEQQRLARALQIRWDLTQRYWSTIATLDPDRWPLEDLPWRTTDGEESDYFTLLVTSMVVQDLVRRRDSDVDLGRVGRVLEELANRGRIIRRPAVDDRAVRMHVPGVGIELVGAEGTGGPPLSLVVSDFAPLLLKRTMQIAGLLGDIGQRERLTTLADQLWDHMLRRRLAGDLPGRDLWDQPGGAFDGIRAGHTAPSWYFTERVVECLVTAAQVISGPPLRSRHLIDQAAELLAEADHLFDQELLAGASEGGPVLEHTVRTVRANLIRAREIMYERPGTAAGLAHDILRDLDRLAAGRERPRT